MHVALRPLHYVSSFFRGLPPPSSAIFRQYSTIFLLTKFVTTLPLAIAGFRNPRSITGGKWANLDEITREHVFFQVRLFTAWMLVFQTPLELYFALYDNSRARQAFILSETVFEFVLTHLYKQDMASKLHPGAVGTIDYNTSLATSLLILLCLFENPSPQ